MGHCLSGCAAPSGGQHRARLDRLRKGAGLTVRPAQAADSPRLAELQAQAYLNQFPTTPQEVASRLSRVGTRCLVAGDGDACLWVTPWEAGGLRLQFMGAQASFTALLEGLLAEIPPATPLTSVVREDHLSQVDFLTASSFRNAHQSWGAHLELSAFDFGPFEALERRLFLAGVEVEPQPDGAELYELFGEARRDMSKNPTTLPQLLSLEDFVLQTGAAQVFAAYLRGRSIGFTWLSLSGAEVESELTVATRRQRGHGVATLLKARALSWARAAGYRQASTGGTLLNLPMLRVNTRLGYQTEPMWFTFVRP